MSKQCKWLAMMVLTLSAALAKAELTIDSGYVRASLPGSTTTSAYMTLNNNSNTDVVITGVTTTAAGKVSFHSTMNHELGMPGDSSGPLLIRFIRQAVGG